MKVALFGGRFDPPHNGHVAIAQEVLKLEEIDEVWFIPDNVHQWNPIVASAANRLKMLTLLVKDNNRMKVSDVAIQIGGSTVTYDVVKKLREERTEEEFVFICGSDQISNFYKWTKWEELKNMISFIIIPRKEYPIEHLPSNCHVLSDSSYEPLEDSSTRIRQLLKEGKSIHGLVPETIEMYIQENNLYI